MALSNLRNCLHREQENIGFERIRARDLWHLTSRVNRKILAHTLCCWLNRQLNRPLLQFDGLVAD